MAMVPPAATSRLRIAALCIVASGLASAASGGDIPPEEPWRSLLQVDPPAGGRVVRLEAFDLQSADADWQFQPNAEFEFVPEDARHPAHWRFRRSLDGRMGRGLWSRGTFPLEANRRYRISALIRSDFERRHSEINSVLIMLDSEGRELKGRRSVGYPSRTDGPGAWQRIETEFVTPASAVVSRGRFGFWFFLGEESETPLDFRIADIALIELPAEAGPIGVDPVSEVTFAGGPGHLPMSVAPPSRRPDGSWRIDVSGVRWTIDPAGHSIVAEQRIGVGRTVAEFSLPGLLADLRVVRQDETVVVLRNEAVAIGVQCDGAIAIAPSRAASLVATSRLDGGFVRFGDGHLFAGDGRGGFTVNPYPRPGSGRLPRSRPVTEGLDFVGFDRDDLQSLSNARDGWQIAWELAPGERIFVSAFPPRAYPWGESFGGTWMLSSRDWDPSAYARDYWRNVAVWLLWDFHWREWGMGFGTEYVPHDPDQIARHVDEVHRLGKRAIFYTSAWFFGGRDRDEYVDAAMEQVDRFGFDGVYSDGLPAVEWLVGYEEMRMLRHRLDRPGEPPGLIYVHDSVPQSGRHPAAWMPWLYTYADVTYMAEHVESDRGLGWNWVRYVISGHATTGGIGAIKGDRWTGPEFDEPIDKYLAALVWNARIGGAGFRGYNDVYVPALERLRRIWEKSGDEPQFYQRHYLPSARELAEEALSRSPTAP